LFRKINFKFNFYILINIFGNQIKNSKCQQLKCKPLNSKQMMSLSMLPETALEKDLMCNIAQSHSQTSLMKTSMSLSDAEYVQQYLGAIEQRWRKKEKIHAST